MSRSVMTEKEAHDLTQALLNQIQADITELKQAREEILGTFGFGSAKPATVAKWHELGEKLEMGQISEKDRLREMTQYLWHEADREKREALRKKQTPPKK